MKTLFAASLLLAMVEVTQAAITRYVDPNGVIHFINAPIHRYVDSKGHVVRVIEYPVQTLFAPCHKSNFDTSKDLDKIYYDNLKNSYGTQTYYGTIPDPRNIEVKGYNRKEGYRVYELWLIEMLKKKGKLND